MADRIGEILVEAKSWQKAVSAIRRKIPNIELEIAGEIFPLLKNKEQIDKRDLMSHALHIVDVLHSTLASQDELQNAQDPINVQSVDKMVNATRRYSNTGAMLSHMQSIKAKASGRSEEEDSSSEEYYYVDAYDEQEAGSRNSTRLDKPGDLLMDTVIPNDVIQDFQQAAMTDAQQAPMTEKELMIQRLREIEREKLQQAILMEEMRVREEQDKEVLDNVNYNQDNVISPMQPYNLMEHTHKTPPVGTSGGRQSTEMIQSVQKGSLRRGSAPISPSSREQLTHMGYNDTDVVLVESPKDEIDETQKRDPTSPQIATALKNDPGSSSNLLAGVDSVKTEAQAAAKPKKKRKRKKKNSLAARMAAFENN